MFFDHYAFVFQEISLLSAQLAINPADLYKVRFSYRVQLEIALEEISS